MLQNEMAVILKLDMFVLISKVFSNFQRFFHPEDMAHQLQIKS